jgi:phosphatidylserine decarboxylase
MAAPGDPTLLDYLNTNLLRILPQHLLAAGMHRLARAPTPWLKDLMIRQVARRYRVDVGEAAEADLTAYPSFNAFFTRALKDGVRPITGGAIVSPADGTISQIRAIRGEKLVQAKGHDFTLSALLAGDRRRSQVFRDGAFVTVYLAPRDYHRVHMPFAGVLDEMVFVPGRLFSVSDATAQLVPGLFARNERVVCYFDTALGPLAVVLVGAIFVGSIETVWHGEVRGQRGQPTKWQYRNPPRRSFAAGDEIGRFNMGSTVIVLLPPGAAEWGADLKPGEHVRMGQALGRPLGP